MSEKTKLVKLSSLTPDNRNANAGTERGTYMLEYSVRTLGAGRGILVDKNGRIIAGNKTVEALAAIGIEDVIIVETDGKQIVATKRTDLDLLTDEEARLMAYADNRVSEVGFELDVEELQIDIAEGLDLSGLFQDFELDELFPDTEEKDDPGAQVDKAEVLLEKWKVQEGDVWRAGEHFIICADCREPETWTRLLDAAGVGKVNGIFTSPPYAEQRKKQYGGVPVDEYVEWWDAVQSLARAHLADDGSFFVNIKPYTRDGQRVLYVFDLVLAMVRQWGWRFIDELCWTHTGFMGKYYERFKNQFEPIYHFSSDEKIKFRFENVSFPSDGIPDSKEIKNATGSPFNHVTKTKSGMARPGNVLIIPTQREIAEHSAVFPVKLPSFFIQAYSDTGDLWCDPFLGSGTTIAAAEKHGRRGVGVERLPRYVSVVLERLTDMGLDCKHLG